MLDALDSLLAALARLMGALQVPFPEFSERMKGHYVRTAETRIRAEGKVTDSRLSLLTGLTRRDIARLRAFQPKPPRVSAQSRLVALWQTDPAYVRLGAPMVLPRAGKAPSFEALSKLVLQDVHPRTLLDTLVLAGTVKVDENRDQVSLVQASYQPLPGSQDQLDYLGKNLGDHLEAAVNNIEHDPAPHFERAVHYTGLTQEQVGKLDAEFRTAQMALLTKLGQQAAAMKASNKGQGTWRFRAGGYLFEKDEGARDEV